MDPEDPKRPARWKPNVTVAAVASRLRDGRLEFLLVEEETADGLRLNNPAGHLDPGESLVEAVCRETLEETASTFAPHALVGVYLARSAGTAADGDTTHLRFAFSGSVGEPDPARALDRGIVRTLWLSLDEIRACAARHRSPLLLRSVEDAAAGKAFPLDALIADESVRHRRA